MQSIEEFSNSWQGSCPGWAILDMQIERYFKKRHWHKRTRRRLISAYTHNELAGSVYRNVKKEIIIYAKNRHKYIWG